MIIPAHRLGDVRRRHAGETIVFANGIFDLFHLGHLLFLQQARRLGDVLVVNVLADKHAAHLKGVNRPIMNQRERVAFIDALGLADYVVRSSTSRETPFHPAQDIKRLKPDVFASRPDIFIPHTAAEYYNEIKRFSPKTRFVAIPETRSISTSKIIARILKRER
ncbi:adenylyltransferase/cytidyltransferase family protein [Candidatus Kaiserbacteria bacterium]|nr:adenylyltransferase/cytidyltransferase family protein [Candidatus Kaiserbacteria bacterium]